MIGTELRLQFAVPELKKTFSVTAEVVHMHTFQAMDEKMKKRVARHGIGLRFINLKKEDEELILKYVRGKDLSVNK